MTESAFCPVALGDWLNLCAQTGVPAITAIKVAEIERNDWLSFDAPGPHQDRLKTALAAIKLNQITGYMLRADCCAGTPVKMAMDRGEYGWQQAFFDIDLDDPRLYEIVGNYPRSVVPIWRRPWVRAKYHGSHPVEYRAFVRDGAIVGISNYYPQRPLPLVDEHLAGVRSLTGQLIDGLRDRTPFEWPNVGPFELRQMNPDGFKLDRAGIHFTADFMVVDHGEQVMFLEGGPPHELGAHMCCFKPNEIDGVALADRNPKTAETKTLASDLLTGNDAQPMHKEAERDAG